MQFQWYEYEYVIDKGGITLYTPLEIGMTASFKIERMSSGIPELDDMFGGGLFKDSCTFISGPSGTGKTMLALIFILEGVMKNENALYISFEESQEQLMTLISMMGYSPDVLNRKLKLKYLSPGLMTPGTTYHHYKMFLQTYKPSRVVIDGISVLERYYGKEGFLELVRSIIQLNNA